jgi:predicted AAA+ superfamily ATPase
MPLKETYFNDIIKFIYAEELFEKYKTVYLFLDEVQRINGWERYIRSIHDEFKDKIKIFVSGSSANLLSKEYSKLLTGRHLTTQVLPLNFREFLQFQDIEMTDKIPTEREEVKIKKHLNEYLHTGGFPDVVLKRKRSDPLTAIYRHCFKRCTFEGRHT